MNQKESPKQELKRLKKYYSEELKRKDKLIQELKEQNILVMKSALKQSKKIAELTEKLKKTIITKKREGI